MKKTFKMSRIGFLSVGALLALLVVSFLTTHTAHAAITSQLDRGANGDDVTELQQFLATNPFIYPAGIVSGHYGPLTEAAVVQFQVAYDIPQVGRVGPTTMAKINAIMASGFGLDISAPTMTTPLVQTSRNVATVSWTTNGPARSQVYYDTSPIQSNEATGHAQQPYVSGVPVSNTNGFSTAQTVTLDGLQSNTLYYYLARAMDSSGNLVMTLSNSFHTDQ